MDNRKVLEINFSKEIYTYFLKFCKVFEAVLTNILNLIE